MCSLSESPGADLIADRPARAWHAVWTRSQSEQLVADQLASLGIQTFLPKTFAWKSLGGSRRRVAAPLLPGYVFLHHALDQASHASVRQTRGVVRVLGESWDRPAVIPAAEMETVHAMASSGAPLSTRAWLAEGTRVRVVAGPLAGVMGLFQKTRRRKGLLLASITVLHRSVGVEVDAAVVEPV